MIVYIKIVVVKLWVSLILVLLNAGCIQSAKHSQPVLPEILIKHNDPNLYRFENKFRYNGRLFSGYIIQQQANARVVFKLPVVDGVANGLALGFYENGNKMVEQTFVQGKLQGPFKQWWRNGQYKYLFFYKADEYEGTQKVFFENGKPREESNFMNGKPEGLQRVWNENGELVSNYTIRNNKLYGIIKVKSCIPGAEN